MRWDDEGKSADIEDRRGESGGGSGGGFRRIGLGGFLLIGVLSLIFRRNLFTLLDTGEDPDDAPVTSAPPSSPESEKLVHFVSFVLDDVQKTWTREFEAMGRPYDHAKLVLFTDSTRSGCGFAESAMGPFYCPDDKKVYIDLGFYAELRRRFGAPGDFAQAYVLAHEMGHHVQDLLGLEARFRDAQARRSPSQRNALSVRFELQADCLAGVWAHSTQERKLLEAGDVEQALRAAAAVGDDRIQKQATGRVNPESWTHGSSEARVKWFSAGFETGRVQDCDTFAGGSRN